MLNLYELAETIGECLIIEVLRENRFRITFNNCEIKDCKSSTVAGTQFGAGDSIDEAADDYFKKINKKWLVFDSLDLSSRREYSAQIYQKS